MSPVVVPPPVSPTFMPHFINRSPSSSSVNTRQRSDYEASQFTLLPSAALDDGNASAAVEMPFASEPALEGEQEAELPPLKKLKSDDGTTVAPVEGIKSILCRKSSGNIEDGKVRPGLEKVGALTPLSLSSLGQATATPIYPTGIPSSSSLAPSPMGLSFSPECSTTASRSMSRRSSSGASSGSGVFKSVRFASCNGFSPFDEDHMHDLPVLDDGAWREDLSSPVVAVVHLTHSREAYDRSPIVVDEDVLKMPPRERKEGGDQWIKCGKRAPGVVKKEGLALKDRVFLGEAAALKGSRGRERLRLEIEALGRGGDGLGNLGAAGMGASLVFRKIGSEKKVTKGGSSSVVLGVDSIVFDSLDTPESLPPSSPPRGSPPAMMQEYSSSTRPEQYEDPNTTRPDKPSDLDADVEAMSDIGDENPGDALSDSDVVSVGSEAGDDVGRDPHIADADDDDDEQGAGLNDDDDDAPPDGEEAVADDDEEEEDPEDVAERRRTRQMGMCGLGKWSRGDVFSACDALGGF